jgi:hypothetical protein
MRRGFCVFIRGKSVIGNACVAEHDAANGDCGGSTVSAGSAAERCGCAAAERALANIQRESQRRSSDTKSGTNGGEGRRAGIDCIDGPPGVIGRSRDRACSPPF